MFICGDGTVVNVSLFSGTIDEVLAKITTVSNLFLEIIQAEADIANLLRRRSRHCENVQKALSYRIQLYYGAFSVFYFCHNNVIIN